jgi:YD repeat-containing protein
MLLMFMLALASSAFAQSRTVQYTYDALDRLIEVDSPESTGFPVPSRWIVVTLPATSVTVARCPAPSYSN